MPLKPNKLAVGVNISQKQIQTASLNRVTCIYTWFAELIQKIDIKYCVLIVSTLFKTAPAYVTGVAERMLTSEPLPLVLDLIKY